MGAVVGGQDEWALQREQLMNTIREQTKENKLLEQIVGVFLPATELGKVCDHVCVQRAYSVVGV